MHKEDLEKRIIFLEKQLIQKKTLIERELLELEKICKEIISMKEKFDKIIAEGNKT